MDVSGVAINIVSAFVAIDYMDHQFEKKFSGTRRKVSFLAAWLFYFLLVTSLNVIMQFEWLLLFSYGAAIAVYGLLALKGHPYHIGIVSLIWVFILFSAAYVIYGIMGIVTGRSLDVMVPLKGDMLIYGGISSCAIKFSMGRIVSLIFPGTGNGKRAEDWVMAGVFLIMFLLLLGIFALEMGGFPQKMRYFVTIFILVAGFGIILVFEKIYGRLNRYQREKMEQEYLIAEGKNREEELMSLYRIGREMNHWRHDIAGEIEILHRLLKSGKVKEVEEYIEKIHKDIKNYPELPQETGNAGLDAALVKAIPKCKEKEIRFHYIILGRPDKIETMDMGKLMNSLLDNGIEACMEAGESRELELLVRVNSEGKLEIQLENSIAASVLENNPEMKSAKRKVFQHGFGMENISEIVNKYHGSYERWEEDKMFFQRILVGSADGEK